MKKIFLLFVCLFYTLLLHANESIELARKEFKKAAFNDKVNNEVYQVLVSSKVQDPLTQAYVAYYTALKARHVTSPYEKITYVRSFDKAIKKAVALAPDNFEIRFLRFSVQDKLPSYLGFSKELVVDKKIILQQIQSHKVDVPANFKKDMKAVLLNSKTLSIAEKKIIEKI
jgi:hypothetical protein